MPLSVFDVNMPKGQPYMYLPNSFFCFQHQRLLELALYLIVFKELELSNLK